MSTDSDKPVEEEGKEGADGRIRELEHIIRALEAEVRLLRDAEKAKDHSAERLCRFFDFFPLPVLIVNQITDEVAYCNRRSEEILEASGDELKSVRVFWHSEERYDGMLGLLNQDGEVDHYAATMNSRKGRRFHAELSAVPIRFQDKSCIILFMKDVTRERTMQLEIENHLHFLRALMSAIPHPVFYKDAEGKYLGCNSGFEKFFGVSDQDIRGKLVHEVFKGKAGLEHFKMDTAILQKGGSVSYETTMINSEGMEVRVMVSKATFRKAEGSVGGVVGFLTDITEIRQKEKMLKESEQALRSIFDSVSEAIFIYSMKGELIDLNRELCEMFQISRDEAMRSEGFFEFSASMAQPKEWDRHWRDAAKGKVAGFEWSARRKASGEHFPVESVLRKTALNGRDVVLMSVRDISERKQKEEIIRRQDLELRHVINSVGSQVFGFDRKAKLIHVNENALKVLGGNREDYLGRAVYEFLGGTNARKIHETIENVIQQSCPELDFEYNVLLPGGKEIWLRADVVPGGGQDEKAAGAIVFAHDVSGRRRAEVALRISEERLRDIIKVSGDCLWETGVDGRFTWVSDAVERLLGCGPESLIGRYFNCRCPESEKEAAREQIERVLSREQEIKGQVRRLQHSNGKTVFVETHGKPIFDDKGVMTGYRGVDRDITDKKISEMDLEQRAEFENIVATVAASFINHKAEETEEALMESLALVGRFTLSDICCYFEADERQGGFMPVSSWIKSGKKHLTFGESAIGYGEIMWNPKDNETISNIVWDQVEDAERLPEFRRRLLDCGIRSFMAFPLIIRGNLFGLLCTTSSEKNFKWSSAALRMMRIIAEIIVNAIDRKMMEEQLVLAKEIAENASRAKSAFLANMSHEIRTPMNGVLGFTELLLEREHDEEDKESLETIHRCGKSLLVIINDILDLSKVEAGKVELNPQPFPLEDLVRDSISIASSKLDGKPIKMMNLVPSFSKYAIADSVRLRQVLVNLLSNAVKYTDAGTVTLSYEELRREHGYVFVAFHVRDTGEGIPENRLEEIFYPFEQGDLSHTKVHSGTGLGLTLCRHLARLMGGDISVESEVGKGSVFSFSFWMQEGAVLSSGDAKDEVVKETEVVSRPLNILLVEDNMINRKLAERILSNMGHDVANASDGREAVERLEKDRFDLIFMDVRMPRLDGMEATRIIRKRGDRTPVVAMTANAMMGDKEECLEAGMNAYISKPVSKDKFKSAIRELATGGFFYD